VFAAGGDLVWKERARFDLPKAASLVSARSMRSLRPRR